MKWLSRLWMFCKTQELNRFWLGYFYILFISKRPHRQKVSDAMATRIVELIRGS